MIRGNIVEAAKGVFDKIPPQYQMKSTQMLELALHYDGKPIELVMAAFNVGYSEGVKAEKARKERMAKCNG